MREYRRRGPIAGIGVCLAALAGAGCMPLDFGAAWRTSSPTMTPTANPSGTPATSAAPPTKAAPQLPNGAPPPTNAGAVCPAAAGPPTNCEPIIQAGYEPPSQVLAMLSQKLAAADDERKILIARLHQLEAVLEARDQALAASAQEITAAQAEIVATRAEMERWKRDMIKLRDKARTMEKENLGTLQSIINMLEQAVETDQEAAPRGNPRRP